MRKDIHVKLDLSVPTRTFVLAMTAVLLVTVTPELGSENVTLSTYYPAPSGVYNKMITTGMTFLAATDTNNCNAAGNSPGSGAFTCSRVGIGTASPASKLSVSGDGTGVANIGGGFCGGNYTGISLNGQSSGCGSYNILSGIAGGDQNLYINTMLNKEIHFRANNVDIVTLDATSLTLAPGVAFKPYIHVDQTATCVCAAGVPNAALCPATQYVTWQSGVYVEGYSYQNRGGGNVVYLPPASGSPNAKVNQVYAYDNIVGSPGNMNWYMSTLAQDFSQPDTVCCCPK